MITKFIEAWILLPGLLILLLLIAGLGLLEAGRRLSVATRTHGDDAPFRAVQAPLHRVRTTAILLIAASGVLYASSAEVVSRQLMSRLERSVTHASAAEIATADAIVVLGGGIVVPTRARSGAPLPAKPDLSAEAKARLLHAYQLAQTTDVPIVVTGGRVFGGTPIPTEAETARRILLELGVAPDRIRVEDRSRSTAQNARYVTEKWGFAQVAVVTSGYHMRRAIIAFEAVESEVLPAPSAYRADRRRFTLIMAMPSMSALHNTVTAVRELIGRAWYQITL